MIVMKKNHVISALACLVLLFSLQAAAQTYTTVANGDWNSPATWQGGVIPPTASDIAATAIINIQHTVAYNTGNHIRNRGTIRIQPLAGSTARLDVPTAINIENFPTGSIYVINGTFAQCRFGPCNDGQPYSGNNPGAPLQSGTFKNLGGLNEARNASIEIAQDWTNENGGTRIIRDSCVKTGQNFSLSGSGTNDDIARSQISVGWHNSGNFEVSDGSAVYDSIRTQLAGTGGSFKLNSGTVNGSISCIQLRNQIVPFVGTGEIFAATSVSTTGIVLGSYCVSAPAKYIPNGKFVGGPTSSCATDCFTCFPPSAASASIEGRVVTAGGYGIRNVTVTISGGDLEEPMTTLTSSFGYYRITGVPVGKTYVIGVRAKRFSFLNATRLIDLFDNIGDLDFVAQDPGESRQVRNK